MKFRCLALLLRFYDNGILIAQAVTDASGSYSIKGVETGRTYTMSRYLQQDR